MTETHRTLFERRGRSNSLVRWRDDPAFRLELFDATAQGQQTLLAQDGVPVGYIR